METSAEPQLNKQRKRTRKNSKKKIRHKQTWARIGIQLSGRAAQMNKRHWNHEIIHEPNSVLSWYFSCWTVFPFVRGREDLLRVPKWLDSSCQTVTFPSYRFYPDKQVHVQITVNHIKLNDSVKVHDAVTAWTENISAKNFTVCALQAGRKKEKFTPFASIDWAAYQGGPPEALTGTVNLPKWWSGTNCEKVTFPKVWWEHFKCFTNRFSCMQKCRIIIMKMKGILKELIGVCYVKHKH